MTQLALKVDVDTDRGTRIGVPNLVKLFKAFDITATFLFSLGPDHTGRALTRVFRKGFLRKVGRTGVVGTYGLRTLGNGILWPGPHIGKRNADTLRLTRDQGFEVGIHAYDHVYWQDKLHRLTQEQVATEFLKAKLEFQRIFQSNPTGAGAAGWQANAESLSTYDQSGLLYGSDTRGSSPFFPKINGTPFKTLQLPTTLPTLDELLGRPQYPLDSLAMHLYSQLRPTELNIMTIHAELEGMKYLAWFRQLLNTLLQHAVTFTPLQTIAQQALASTEGLPACEIIQGHIDGRSGSLAIQVV